MTSTLDVPRPAVASAVEVAPYALLRLAALSYPDPPAGADSFRSALADLVELTAGLDRLGAGVADALHDSASDHPADFHRAVVLPLRRAVFNGRLPRPAVLADAGDLPHRVAGLADWLTGMSERARLSARLDALAPAALAAERAVVAELCGHESLRKAVTITGRDLLRGIDRAGAAGDDPDARARKAEPTVLRYVLRASAKVSPLSWYTHVAWGSWTGGSTPDAAEPVAVVRANRLLVASLVAALVGDPARRERLPHRIAPATRDLGDRISFRRDIPSGDGGHVYRTREEQVDLPATAAIRFLIAVVRASDGQRLEPTHLIDTLSTKLGGAPERSLPAAAGYVRRMIDIGLLVPVEPVDPQAVDVLTRLADWLLRHDEPTLARLLRTLESDTASFAALPADDRSAGLDRLTATWRAVGERAGVDLSDSAPVNEDVVLTGPVALGRRHGRAALQRLADLTPFLTVFDQQVLLRRQLRDRFVARHGVGGTAALADCAPELATDWAAGFAVGPDGRIAAGTEVGAAARALAAARAELTDLVRANAAGIEAVVPDSAVEAAAGLLPAWARSRPVSYGFFAQPVRGVPGVALALNHIYGGFGQFTSRFLSELDAGAAAAVRARIGRTFPAGHVAQFRPVRGFTANLHPMLTGLEVGEDPAHVDLAVDALQLWHDDDADQIRLRVRGTNDVLDVLYLGFLVPYVLPERLAALHGDLGGAMPRIGHLGGPAPEGGTRRLRYRDVVLSRRSWRLAAVEVADLRTDLQAAAAVPAVAIARLRARLGLPEHVFLGAGGSMTSREDFERRVGQPKPQYVDLGNALHLRCLPRLLARHTEDVTLTEALPIPGAQCPDGRVTELVVETYWRP